MIKKLIAAAITALIAILATANIVFAQAPSQNSVPTLEILTPKQDQVIYGDKLPILFNVTNFELVDPQKSPTPAPGKGHINVWIDDSNPSADSAAKISEDNYTFSDVTFGTHTLKAALVGNDNSPLNPPVTLTINFKTAPQSTPTVPQQNVFDKNTALIIFIVVALVIVAAWWYTKEDDEEEKPAAKITKKSTKVVKSSRKKPGRK